MRPTTSKSSKSQQIGDQEIINRVKVFRLTSLTQFTDQVKYVSNLLKSNHDQQQSIQNRYQAYANEPASVLVTQAKLLLDEHGKACEDHTYTMRMVKDMLNKLETFETGISYTTNKSVLKLARKSKSKLRESKMHGYGRCKCSKPQPHKSQHSSHVSQSKNVHPMEDLPESSDEDEGTDDGVIPSTLPRESPTGGESEVQATPIQATIDHTLDILDSLQNISNLMDILRN